MTTSLTQKSLLSLSLYFSFSALLASIYTISNCPEVFAQGNAQVSKYIAAGNYKAAYPGIRAMSQANPKDISLQYYLGVCAAAAGDKKTAELAHTRVMVGSDARSSYFLNSSQAMARLNPAIKPYSCKRGGQTHRWAPSAMPLKVYIFDGKSLNPSLAGRELGDTEVEHVTALLQDPGSVKPVPGYKPSFKRAVADGMQAWDWAIKSGLVKFALVGSPNGADIVVLFCDHGVDGAAGATSYPYGSGQPSIIQLAVNASLPEMEAFNAIKHAASMQIGHALGLGQSSNPKDLMSGSGLDKPSQNDLATLRALYSMGTDVVMQSAR